MNLSRSWKSTGNNKAPTGRKQQGTFRDVSLFGLDPTLIDQVDSECIDRNIARSYYIIEYWQSLENWDESVFPTEVVRAAGRIELRPLLPVEPDEEEKHSWKFDIPIPQHLLKD